MKTTREQATRAVQRHREATIRVHQAEMDLQAARVDEIRLRRERERVVAAYQASRQEVARVD